VNGLLGNKLSFEELGDARRSGSVTRALDTDGEFWEMYPETALAQVFLWGLLLNVGLAEIVWERNVERDNKWQQRLIPKHPRNLRYDWETRRWILRIASKDGIGTEDVIVTPGDGRWFLYQPHGDSPYIRGIWWALGLVWLSKQFADFDWGRRNEARGRSALVGTTPDGAGDTDRTEFARQIALLRTQLGIALPSGYDLKSVEFGADDHETFLARIEGCNSDYAILALGQNLTTEVKAGGSYAAGRSQERVRQDYLEQDAELFATCMRAQAIVYFAAVRFSDPLLAPYPKWDVEPPENQTVTAETWARASEALDRMLSRNLPIDVEAYLKRFKIPIGTTVGKVITGPNKPVPTTPPAKPGGKDNQNAGP
jgi:hypothetical protein